jgi:transglutaminase-like putative cysteine protease
MRFFRYFLVITSGFLFPLVADARLATPEDLDLATEFYNRTIYIKKEGTYEETIERAIRATKESGKDKLVSIPIIYNAANSELKVLAAKTVLGGIEHPLDLTQIEDKPLASSPRGFDQNRQLLLAFPQVALEATVYLKYKIIVKEAAIPGVFSSEFIYGSDSYWRKSHVQVVSELPLFIAVNDKEGVLKIVEEKREDKYYLDIILNKPVIKVAVEEEYMASENERLPWVSISTLKEWPKLEMLLKTQYETILNQKLPTLFQEIAKEAATKTDILEKLNTITARLAENISYMGDWRTIKGAFIPRNLNEIARSKIGDCKDFSASMVAILREIGIPAKVAIINRGREYSPFPNHLPTLYAFNHALVYVKVGEKIFWIDPTNFTSFAQGIYPDIADRPALVLNSDSNEVLLKTPALDPTSSLVSISKTITLPKDKEDITHINGKISLSGILALPLVGADLRFSKETIQQGILNMLTEVSRVTESKISEFNLLSRIASALEFNFTFTEKHTRLKTTAGDAFLLPEQGLITKLLVKTADRVSDLRLSEPFTLHSETLLAKTSLVGREGTFCKVDSPWLQASRKVENTDKGIKIFLDFVVKKDKILNSELKSEEYAQFQNKIFSCFGETAIVYK